MPARFLSLVSDFEESQLRESAIPVKTKANSYRFGDEFGMSGLLVEAPQKKEVELQ